VQQVKENAASRQMVQLLQLLLLLALGTPAAAAAANAPPSRSVLRVELASPNVTLLAEFIDLSAELWGHRSRSVAEVLIADSTEHVAIVALAQRVSANLSVIIEDVDAVVRSQKAARSGDGWHPLVLNAAFEPANAFAPANRFH